MFLPAIACLTCLAIGAIAKGFFHEGLAQIAISSAASALALALLFCCGPDRETWSLTAPGTMPKPKRSPKGFPPNLKQI